MSIKPLHLLYFLVSGLVLACSSPSQQELELAEHYYGKALVAKSNLDYHTALAYLDSALQKNPRHFMALLHQGLIYARMHDYERSDAAYRRALKIRPDFLDARYNLGNNALRRQHYKDAIRIYEDLLKFKEAPEFWHNLGRAHLELGDSVQAARCFQRALALDSTYAYAYHNLGTLAERGGNYTAAVRYYRLATRHAPASDEYWFKFGLVLQQSGKKDSAEYAFKKALAINPYHTGAVFNLARLYQERQSPEAEHWLQQARELRQQDAVLSRLRRAIVQNPRDPSIHHSMAMEYVKRKQWLEAIREFKLALSLRPNDYRSRINLANVYMVLGNVRKALSEYEKVLGQAPLSREALANIGLAYLRLERPDSARLYWMQLLKIDPGNAIAREGLQQLNQQH